MENSVENIDLGSNGQGRRTMGIIILILFGISAHMDGYSFYEINQNIIWALGLIGLALLISGIAKDVVAIAKNAVK